MNRDDTISEVFHLLSVAYKNLGEYEKADKYCKKSVRLK
jgi:hypothetical protein